MTHLGLSLLGPFQVTLDGQAVSGFKSAKVRALLAYLASEAQQPRYRRTLACLLWPELPDRDASNNLRTALSLLRDVIGDRTAAPPFLLISRDAIQFNAASDHWLDVSTFEQHMADGRWPTGDGDRAIDHLLSASRLYRGSFLEGVYADSAAFEEWVLLKREQFQRRMMTALRGLAAYYEQNGQYEQAQSYTLRQLELESWDEQAHQQLMRLLASSGRRSAALIQYQTCRRLLAEELGVEPADDTTALYKHIRDGVFPDKVTRRPGDKESPPSFPVPLSPPFPVSPTPFVARKPELAKLDDFLDLALAGYGRAAFVIGDAGSGKTALIGEFTRRAMAAHRDLILASGKCNAHAGIGDPYLPFCEVLQMLTGDIEAKRTSGAITPEHARRLWALLPAAAQALVEVGPGLIGRLVPAEALALRVEAFAPRGALWRGRLEELTKGQQARGDLAGSPQADLFEQITHVLQNLARRNPLILVLDDLQWADSGTLSLLFHLGRRLVGHRILVVGAYRPADLAPGQDRERHPLEPVVNELQRDVGDVQVDLNQADGRQFVEAFLDTEPNRLGMAFREILYRHTGGNPLFTVELLRGLEERGDLVQDPAGCWVEGPNPGWERLPPRVEAVIAERIGRVSPECRELLAVASVEGEAFTAEAIAQVLGQDEREVIRRLSGPLCRQHRLVIAHSVRHVRGRRLSSYRFRHILFQNYLYRSLDEVERPRLHEAVGTALEALHAQRTVEISGELARHFEAAGMISKAVDYLLQAGNRAVQLSAYEEAITPFARGLELLETLPETSERDRQEFALRLALYAPITATRGYACPELARSNARAHQLSLRLGEEQELIPALTLLAGFYSFRAEFQTALDLAERALALAERIGAPGHIVWAQQVIGMTLTYRGDIIAAREHLEQTLKFDDSYHKAMVPVRGIDARVAYRSFAAWVLWLLGYPDQASQLGQEAFYMAQETNHPPSVSMALHVGSIVLHLLLREYGAIPKLIEAYTKLTAGHRLSLSQAGARIACGRAMVHHGQVKAGIQEMQQGLVDWQATGTRAWASLYFGLLAEAYLEAGQPEQAQGALDEAFMVVRQSDERMVEAELHRLQGEVLLARAREDEAAECYRQAIAVARRQQARSWELRATTSLCRLWRRQDKVEEARKALQAVYSWFTEGFDTPDLNDARVLLEELRCGSHPAAR